MCVLQLERPTFYDNAFYGVPDETTQGLNASALTPLLKEIGAGAGLGVLRLGSSARHREVVARMTPHEIALAAAGLAPSLGVLPPRAEHVLHLTQGHTPALGAAVAPPPCWLARWPVDDAAGAEVTLVACVQDGCAGAAPTGPPYGRGRCHMIWAAPAVALLEAVRARAGPELAELLLDPVYTTAAAAMAAASHADKPATIGGWSSPGLEPTGDIPLEDQEDLLPVFCVSERSGRVRSLLGVGLGAAPSTASPQHAEALAVLHAIAADPLTWTVLDLQAGDIVVCDNVT